MMRAAQYARGGVMEVVEVEPRPPGPGEVQIDVAFVGICGTDLHILHGAMDERVDDRAVIGHETAGLVHAVGKGVTDWSAGDPVTVMPLEWCGTCPTCIAGHRHICDQLNFVGIDSPGSLQEMWTVPQELLVRLPPGLALRDGALVEPVAVAHHDVRRAQLEPGQRVAVVGGGPVGVLIAIVAAAEGAEVRVLETNPFRRSVIAGLGLDAVDPVDIPVLIEEWTGGAGADVVFEVSGAQGGLDSAVELLRARGRLVVVGIHAQRRELDLKRVFWKELEIAGARVYEPQDFSDAVESIAAGAIPVEALISKIVPLDSAAEGFEILDLGGAVMKVLVDCGGAERL